MTRTVTVCLALLALALPATGQKPGAIISSVRLDGAVDADVVLKCRRGPGIAGNAAKINAAWSGAKYRYGVQIPGGYWAIDQTLSLPGKTGPVLVGAGGTSKDFGDNAFPDLQGSSYVSRLVWEGPDQGTMIVNDSIGAKIADMHIQGCRVAGAGGDTFDRPGAYPNRAKIGIHINSTRGASPWINTSKCFLDNLSFYQVHTGILAGSGLTGGETSNHADSIYAGRLHFYMPHVGPYGFQGTCAHIRNEQSVDNYFGQIICKGNPAQVFWQERGGKTYIGQLAIVGSRKPGSGVTYAIRVGKMDVSMGLLHVGQVSFDASSRNARLLKMDDPEPTYPGPTIVIGGANIPYDAITVVPQIDARPGKVMVNNTSTLRANSIRLTGSGSRICEVNLIGCVLDTSNPEDLIDDANSAGPYILRWRNCSLRHQARPVAWGRPIRDGKCESPGFANVATEIVN